jgi:hypothetical protein
MLVKEEILKFCLFLIIQKAVQKYIEEQILNLLVSNHLKKLGFGQAKEHKKTY